MKKPIKQYNLFGGVDLVQPTEPKPSPDLKQQSGSKYAQYGLDDRKEPTEKGSVVKEVYDFWLHEHVPASTPHVYLCFAHFALTQRTIQAFLTQPPIQARDEYECFKCKEWKAEQHYYVPGVDHGEYSVPWGICDECVRWAADYLARRAAEQAAKLAEPPPPPPVGTQLSLI